MANEIDILMDLDPLSLAEIEGGVDGIIAIMRNYRARADAGIKPKRESGPKVTLNLEALGLAPKPGPAIKRRG